MKRNKSIITEDLSRCFLCGTTNNIHIHEVFFGKNRQSSIKEHLYVGLCGEHHNLSNNSVHHNHEIDLKLKRYAEKIWLVKNKKTIEDFIKIFGKNYLEEE